MCQSGLEDFQCIFVMIPVVPVIVIDDLFANIALPSKERLTTRAYLGAVLIILLASFRHLGQVHERTLRY